jgi:hypothetical protein
MARSKGSLKAKAMNPVRRALLLEIDAREDPPTWSDLVGLVVNKVTIGPKETQSEVRWLWVNEHIQICNGGLPFRYEVSEASAAVVVALKEGSSGDHQKDTLDKLTARFGDLKTAEMPGSGRVIAVPLAEDGSLDIIEARWVYLSGVVRAATADDVERYIEAEEAAA